MKYRLTMDLGFHNDEDFDLESFKEEFEETYVEEENEESEELEVEEEEQEEIEEETDEDEIEEQPENKDAKAFATMRNQLKQSETYANFVKNLSEAYDITPEELMQRFEDQQLENDAKEQNTSPEVLKRLRDLEAQNQNLTKQQINERIGQDIAKIKSEYGVDDQHETIQKTFAYIAQNYVDSNNIPTISFEDAYILANKDEVFNKSLEKARQKDLETKKKRQASSAFPANQGETLEGQDLSLDDVAKQLDAMGIRID